MISRNRGSDVRSITGSRRSRDILLTPDDHSSPSGPQATRREYRLLSPCRWMSKRLDRSAARLARRDQRGAAIGRHQRQYGIGGIGGFVVRIDRE